MTAGISKLHTVMTVLFVMEIVIFFWQRATKKNKKTKDKKTKKQKDSRGFLHIILAALEHHYLQICHYHGQNKRSTDNMKTRRQSHDYHHR